MNSNQQKGIGFIIGGVLLYFLLPQLIYSILGMLGIYFGIPAFVFVIIALLLVGIGIKYLIEKPEEFEENNINLINNNMNSENQTVSVKSNQSNKIVNVTLRGGLIGMLADSPQKTLNRKIKKENENGWKVIQVIPSSSGNILLLIFRIILLIITVFLFTTANGYYVIMEKK